MASRVVYGSGNLSSSLEQAGGRIVAAINDAMGEAMKTVQEKAVAYVPVEKHNLENAIALSNSNRRRHWVVFIDTSKPDDTGKYTVGDYANFIHESQYDLGKASKIKDRETGKVGPKFLERAFKEVVDDNLINKLKAMALRFGVR